MIEKINQINVFISCPDDVLPEKQIVRNVCQSLTKALIKKRKIRIEPIDWRENVIPLITGEGAQSVIDKQIEEYDYDIYLGILWKRFGDKQSNGTTPTEGEFEDALKRRKKTGKPLIKFYFKLEKKSPSNSYEEQQISEVQKFKERIKSLGYYDEFVGKSNFQEKVYESILYFVENFDYLISNKLKISKIQYPEISNYLIRKVYPAKEYKFENTFLLKSELFLDIIKIITQYNRIVLLSDAGVGKTTELKQIAYHFSDDGPPLVPYFVQLNKYVDQDLSEILPIGWNEIPESQLLIILDGLDEIESKNKNGAIRKIELFSEQYPSSHIIVSCRTNFYKSGTKQTSGTLSGFSSYILLDLVSEEINKYIETKLGNRATDFNESIFRNKLRELLKIPFYLIRIIDLYKANLALPQSRAELFEQLLDARIQFDMQHFRTTIELDEKQQIIIETLERLALGMEVFCRNYIINEEYQQLIPDESLRDLIKHCTIWNKSDGESITWQFEHNNFQEYLAAKILSRQSLTIIKEFISFQANYQKIIPSWKNTLSFLFSIIDKKNPLFNDLLNWIKMIEPEILIKFEPDKVEITTRIQIFKNIFNQYKEKQIWINRDKFSYDDLAHFGQSEETINYILKEIENATHYTTLCNAIELLEYLNIPYDQKQRTTKLLMNCALDNDKKEIIQNRALITLASLKINSEDLVNLILSKLRSSESDLVRYGLYYYIYNSDYLDQNIDVFLEGIKFVRFNRSTNRRETRLGDEHWHLIKGLEKAKSATAIKKIFTYLKENPGDLDTIFYEKSLSIIAENAAKIYHDESSIFELGLDLFSILVLEHLKKKRTRQFIRFFDITNTRLQAFQKMFAQINGNKDSFVILASLADLNCLEFFVKQYEENNLLDNDIWTFQNYLLWKNEDLYLPFNKLINEVSGDKFILPIKRDFEKERKKSRQNDLNLLFDKKAFLNEIKRIFDTEQKNIFTNEELLNIQTQHWENPYFSDLAIHTLRKISDNQSVTLEITIQIINDWDWDWFCISNVYEYLKDTQEEILSEEQRSWIGKWCSSNLNKINFKTVLTMESEGRSSTSWKAIFLWFFLRKLKLTYLKNVLLDMLSFDWIDEHQMLGIGYLEEQLNEDEITERILENLQKGIQNNDVLKNHIDYCKRHDIKEILPFALNEIANSDRDTEVRRIALETICERSGTLTDLEQILPNITDDFKWNVIEELIKHDSKYSHKFLQNILKDGNEQDQFIAGEFLIKFQDIQGLKYYVEWIKKHKQFPEKPFEKSPLLSLNTIESVPFLIELLEISYQEDFVQDEFNRLDRVVLDTMTKLALQSDQHYIEIKKAIGNFINEYSSIIKDVNFLHVFLEKLEQKYYVIKSEEFDINKIIKKLEMIYPH